MFQSVDFLGHIIIPQSFNELGRRMWLSCSYHVKVYFEAGGGGSFSVYFYSPSSLMCNCEIALCFGHTVYKVKYSLHPAQVYKVLYVSAVCNNYFSYRVV